MKKKIFKYNKIYLCRGKKKLKRYVILSHIIIDRHKITNTKKKKKWVGNIQIFFPLVTAKLIHVNFNWIERKTAKKFEKKLTEFYFSQ